MNSNMQAPPRAPRSFSTLDDLMAWLASHHTTEPELWVRIYKRDSGTASVTWEDCVIASLTWGWIDGQRRALDEVSFLQRLTPRRARSTWSQRNCEHAERLIAEGKMQPAGLAQVVAAREDGRWQGAYAGSASMVLPADFLAELAQHPEAQQHFATLDRRNLFAIYYRLHSAQRPETRRRRIADIIQRLGTGRAYH